MKMLQIYLLLSIYFKNQDAYVQIFVCLTYFFIFLNDALKN